MRTKGLVALCIGTIAVGSLAFNLLYQSSKDLMKISEKLKEINSTFNPINAEATVPSSNTINEKLDKIIEDYAYIRENVNYLNQ